MNYYGEKEVANVLRLLDKMRNEYPKEEEKYKALSIAIDSILNDGIHVMREIDGDTSDGYHTFNVLSRHFLIKLGSHCGTTMEQCMMVCLS